MNNRKWLRPFILSIFVAGVFTGWAQRYNFSGFSVEQGLSQSQPVDICQDATGYLWIATFGGVSRYDGRNFYNYSIAEGLKSHLVYRVFADTGGNIWLGTETGLQRFDGRRFHDISLPSSLPSHIIMGIAESREAGIFVRTFEGKLFSVSSDQTVSPEEDDAVITSLQADGQGVLHVAVAGRGVYKLQNKAWQKVIDFSELKVKPVVKRLLFDRKDNCWLLGNRSLYRYSGGELAEVVAGNTIPSALISIAEDHSGRIWLGTTRGAYILEKAEKPRFVGSVSGLTDVSINQIIPDREGNLWFATDGEGIFRLASAPFYIVDRSSGLAGNVVMAIVTDGRGITWVGTTEGGLEMQEANGAFRKIRIPSSRPEAQKINAMLIDSGKDLWVGTLGGGLWKRNVTGVWTEVLMEGGLPPPDIVSIYESSDKTIWVSSVAGLFFTERNTLRKLKNFTSLCFSIADAEDGAVLAGSVSGLWKISDRSVVTELKIPGCDLQSVNCFARWKNGLLLGTGDQGILYWDKATNRVLRCGEKEGLASDFIFSLYTDSTGAVYAGTGHGISKILRDDRNDKFTVTNFFTANNLFGPECNLNAVNRGADGSLMFGTTRGLAVLDHMNYAAASVRPLIHLNGVRLFSKNLTDENRADTLVAWHKLPAHLELSHRENHITFDFSGIYLSHPQGLRYRYQLEGADTSWSGAVSVSGVIYSNLSPGKYRFRAMAVTESGVESVNEIDFPFEIRAPFFQQNWFRVAFVLLLVGLGAGIQSWRIKYKNKRAASLKKIMLEEQKKMQERISEDLHDDLGNKITRITVLADILNRVLPEADEEKKRLVAQIKENANSLYLGTKDIIWSVTPGYGNWQDIIERCRSFGLHLFERTETEFRVQNRIQTLSNMRIPLLLNRSLVMIVKEGLNNILKHANATYAELVFDYEGEDCFSVYISDNGKGLDTDKIKAGNGLANMTRRAERVGGHLQVRANTHAGTVLQFTFKITPNEG